MKLERFHLVANKKPKACALGFEFRPSDYGSAWDGVTELPSEQDGTAPTVAQA